MSPIRSLLLGLGLAVLGGCAGLPAERAAESADTAACRDFLNTIETTVAHHEAADVEAARIDGFPYLRVDRFLAGLRFESQDPPVFEAWVDRLQRLAEEGRHVELRNLPAAARAGLVAQIPPQIQIRDPEQAARRCGTVLRRADLVGAAQRAQLRERTVVAPDYRTWQRIVGLYFLTALPTRSGVTRLYREIEQVYAEPLETLPVHGRLVRYAPPRRAPLTRAEVAEILARAAQNPLHIPEPQGAERERLFEAFAPVWEVDVTSDDDRLGAPAWRSPDGAPTVDTRDPVVYRRLSHAVFQGQVLLQLNYGIWFPARPRTSAFDILAGHLDGILLRVTLGPDGAPLLYDAIHQCGCYHLFFPSERLRARLPEKFLQEPAFVPQAAPVASPGEALVVRIAHRTHYLERLYAALAPAAEAVYRFADYAALRLLALPDGGRRSLFRPDGLVPDTDRRERWLLWPMGIPHPGAMRQWGHHATAFVGRRHFDDPDLIEKSFAPVPR